jgi:hypothetical protein
LNPTRPIVTFRVSVPSKATPEAVYAVLADLTTHMVWTGGQAPDKRMRLLSLDAPSREATVGDRFTSTGANILSMRFHDSSQVVDAQPAASFGFDTDSRLERKHRPAWLARFTNRYTITPTPDGATIGYVCEVWPQNYIPWWLSPLVRPMTRISVPHAMGKNMENLAHMAEAVAQRPRDTSER